MDIQEVIKLYSKQAINDSILSEDTKTELLNHVKEADIYEVMALLMDGKIQSVSEQSKPVVLERFKKSEVPNKIKHFVEQESSKKIDKNDVKQAAMKTAKKVHGEPDEKIVDDIVNKAIKKGKDTEDAIQIAINMISAEE